MRVKKMFATTEEVDSPERRGVPQIWTECEYWCFRIEGYVGTSKNRKLEYYLYSNREFRNAKYFCKDASTNINK